MLSILIGGVFGCEGLNNPNFRWNTMDINFFYCLKFAGLWFIIGFASVWAIYAFVRWIIIGFIVRGFKDTEKH